MKKVVIFGAGGTGIQIAKDLLSRGGGGGTMSSSFLWIVTQKNGILL